MLRGFLAAIAGYVVMVAVVMSGIGLAWVSLGAEGAFAGEGPEPSGVWMVLNYLSGFIAAFAGGWAALRIGRSELAVRILAGLIVVFGVYTALTAEANRAENDPLDKPVAEMTFREAGQHAQVPAWYHWTIPIVGLVGVLLGGRRRQ